MAIENAKVLNTRIILKNDDLAKWNDSKLVLEKGEIALAAITTHSDGDVKTPTYLMKVGDGVNTFANLKWIGAQAADVYNWAKQNSLFIEASGTGNVVSDISWDATLNDNRGGVKVTKVAVATSVALEETLERVTALENGKLDKATFESFQTANTTAIGTAKSEAISSAATTAQEKVDALKNGDVKANADAIAAIKDHESVDSFADVMAEIAKKQDTIPANTYDAYGSAAAAQAAAATDAQTKADAAKDAAIADANGKIATLTQTVADNKTAAESYADQAELDAIASAKGYTDAEVAKVSAIANDAATKAALEEEANRAKGVENNLQTQINTIMSNPDAEGAINSINEFTQYIEEHGEIAEGFRTDIDKNKEDIASEVDRAKKAEQSLLDKINALDSDYASEEDLLNGLASVVGTANDASSANTVYGAKKYTDEEIVKAKEDASNKDAVVLAEAQKYADQAETDAIASANGYTDGKIGEVNTAISNQNTTLTAAIATAKGEAISAAASDAESKYEKINVAKGLVDALDGELAAIAKTGSTDDLVQGSRVLVFDCGTSAN